MDIALVPLEKNDPEIGLVRKMHDEPTVSKYISISDQYFDYVTGTENVVYLKIESHDELIGGIHSETAGTVLYLSICIREQYRKKGFATAALRRFISLVPDPVERIQVSIEETNVPSIRLFEGLGFSETAREEELIDYILDLRGRTD